MLVKGATADFITMEYIRLYVPSELWWEQVKSDLSSSPKSRFLFTVIFTVGHVREIRGRNHRRMIDIHTHAQCIGMFETKLYVLGPLLLAWCNLSPNMDKWLRCGLKLFIYSQTSTVGCIDEVRKLISNLFPHFTMDVITYPCWD